MRVLMIAPSGAGKGTQGALIAALEAMRPLLEHVPAQARLPVDLTSLGDAFGVTDPTVGTSG